MPTSIKFDDSNAYVAKNTIAASSLGFLHAITTAETADGSVGQTEQLSPPALRPAPNFCSVAFLWDPPWIPRFFRISQITKSRPVPSDCCWLVNRRPLTISTRNPASTSEPMRSGSEGKDGTPVERPDFDDLPSILRPKLQRRCRHCQPSLFVHLIGHSDQEFVHDFLPSSDPVPFNLLTPLLTCTILFVAANQL